MGKLWLLPLILVLVAGLALISAVMGLSPLPYYLGLLIPYLIGANLGLIVYIAVKYRGQLLKVILLSILSLGLAYLWLTQAF